MKKIIIVLVLLNILTESYSQTNDTVINKKHYGFRTYYSSDNLRTNFDSDKNQPILSLGNIIDSKKEGHWIYYLQNGSKFAEGNYKNGRKIGKWFFYKGSSKACKTLKYSKENNLLDQIFIDEFGHLEIRDITEKYNQIIFVNGWRVESPVRFLD